MSCGHNARHALCSVQTSPNEMTSLEARSSSKSARCVRNSRTCTVLDLADVYLFAYTPARCRNWAASRRHPRADVVETTTELWTSCDTARTLLGIAWDVPCRPTAPRNPDASEQAARSGHRRGPRRCHLLRRSCKLALFLDLGHSRRRYPQEFGNIPNGQAGRAKLAHRLRSPASTALTKMR